jgi:hypothetical protein
LTELPNWEEKGFLTGRHEIHEEGRGDFGWD